MGCDIHGRVQYRYEDGEWFDDGPIPDCRSYRLFAALAGVRNGYGFAGMPTHEPIKPISEPRGLPDDIPNHDDQIWFGDHSFSWLTLDEIRTWDGWDKCLSDMPDVPLRQRCSSFHKWLEWQESRQLSTDYGRIVFGFDS